MSEERLQGGDVTPEMLRVANQRITELEQQAFHDRQLIAEQRKLIDQLEHWRDFAKDMPQMVEDEIRSFQRMLARKAWEGKEEL